MLYIRELFKQDLRDGKQIAFPKEPSTKFFEFDYQNNPEDRQITFTYVSKFDLLPEFEGKKIETRLYACASESRIDGQLKGFLRDELSAQIGDIIILGRKEKDNKNYTVSFIPKTSKEFDLIHEMLDGKNHVLATVSEPLNIPDPIKGTITGSIIKAIRTKPFVLLAGISGTGKSRIVRQLAKACWDSATEEGRKEAEAHKPANFEMVQVKPNWHDSSDLIGYVSRISGEPEFVVGDFLRFVVKAWVNKGIPFFLCLDEMNLAPVEQYFAEYLSVVESRKLQNDKITIKTDALLDNPFSDEDETTGAPKAPKWYENLVDELLRSARCPDEEFVALREQFLTDGIGIPQNLIVIGTVNMDETTYSFSRKVLDRAMTIEMNVVDLKGGLDKSKSSLPHIPANNLLADAVEGFDVYELNKAVCDKVIDYLNAVNAKLTNTPFRVAYRTRNEFLIYVVNAVRLAGEKVAASDEEKNKVIANALDEVTSMKILSRIEGDRRKVYFLGNLKDTVKKQLDSIDGGDRSEENSTSLAKMKTMEERLASGYTSFWD